MHPSLAWRSTILQIAWLGGVIALALAIKDEPIRYTLVGAFAGYGGALIQKARQSAAGGGDTGSPGGLLPGPMGGGGSLPPGSVARVAIDAGTSPFAKTTRQLRGLLAFALLGALVAALLISCKSPNSPPDAATDASPVVVVAEDVKVVVDGACETITAITPDATVQLACATAEEIAQVANIVAQAFGVALDGGALKCVAAQQQTFCATPAQMQKALNVVLSKRAEAGATR